MPTVPTPPPATPKPPAAKPTAASAAPPAIKPPKLNFAERNALNGAVESAQEWLKANDAALRAQANARIDQAIDWIEGVVKPAVDKAITWVGAKLATTRFK